MICVYRTRRARNVDEGNFGSRSGNEKIKKAYLFRVRVDKFAIPLRLRIVWYTRRGVIFDTRAYDSRTIRVRSHRKRIKKGGNLGLGRTTENTR